MAAKRCRLSQSLLGPLFSGSVRVRLLPLFALLGCLLSLSANALSLGEVQVQSKLNQPFSAQIEVLSATASEIGSLRVGLAGEQDWQRAGLTPQGSASRIRFGFVATGGGNLAITMRTDEPVREPLLVFLVDAAWSSGHLLREYTVFLDPDALPEPQAAPVNAPSVNRPSGPQPSQASPSITRQSFWGRDYGPVKNGQSLSQIAEQLIEGSDLRRHQMMWALFKSNPEAFTGNNINWLNVGANLTVPTQEEASAISPRRATQLVWQAADQATYDNEPKARELIKNEPKRNEAQVKPETKPEPEPQGAVAPTITPTEQPAEPVVPSGVDKLELLPLEPLEAEQAKAEATEAESSPTSPAVAGEESVVESAQPIQLANSNLAVEPGQRERELSAENALLKERINETEALLKEIRSLLAARSEQLSDLQSRLERVEASKTAAPQEPVVTQQTIGWFWWLLLVVAILLVLLLVALLFVLTRRQQTVQQEPLEAESTPVPAPSYRPPVMADAAPESKAEDATPHPSASGGDPLSAAIVASSVSKEEDETPVQVEPAVSPVAEPAKENVSADKSASPNSVLDEQREAFDDTPLEFDVGSYSTPVEEENVQGASAKPEASIDLPELGESFTDADIADESLEALDDKVEASLPELPEILDPIAEPESLLDPLEENSSPGLETTSVIDSDELLVAGDELPSLLSESDTETLEIDAALSQAGDSLVDGESNLAVDNAVESFGAESISETRDVSEFSGGDQVATKLDLARVYADMGDAEEARSILQEVLGEGSEAQRKEAQDILDSL